MVFEDIQGLIEETLGYSILRHVQVSSSPYRLSRVEYAVLDAGSHSEPLYIKYGTDVARETRAYDLLRSHGVLVPDRYSDDICEIDVGSQMPIDIIFLRPIDGVSLLSIAQSEPDNIARHCAQAFVEFHSHVVVDQLVHGDLHLENIFYSAVHPQGPRYIFLDCPNLGPGRIMDDVRSLCFDLQDTTKDSCKVDDFWEYLLEITRGVDVPGELYRCVKNKMVEDALGWPATRVLGRNLE